MKPNAKRAMECEARRRAAGVCIKCGEALFGASKNFCLTHLEYSRKKSLAASRKKAGIPEDRGLYERGPKEL